MRSVGVRELKERTSEILRRVREDGEAVEITLRGHVVARIVPAQPVEPNVEESSAVWADLDQLAAEIGARWPVGLSAVDALRRERGER